ncbi:ABC transporter permease [Frigidibacter sp.]|uniref:ABC transporter permease n=1 Tax=Frigidibacter sp. TaxID=2586418 RepID=UPI002732C37B|nr:ABC transporter permease [Frigidibacter sp.]MDP3339550.1 ABC transporter permease [Frigidibacter sp.]
MVAIDAEVPEDMRGGLTTADGKPLKQALAHAQARAKRKALLLVVPLLAFILITFVMPIGQLLFRSIHNDGFSANMPQISAWFDETKAGDAPDEAAYAALVADIAAAAEARTIGVVGTRVNYELSGTRSLFTSAGRNAEDLQPPYREAMLDLNEKWGDPQLWGVMRSVSSAYSANFYLAALDLARDENGEIVRAPEDRRIYGMLFMRTLWLSALITGLCLILAYPVAHLLAVLPLAKSNLLMILVLLPFWTSLLVRTTSWMVMLQEQGVINNTLVALGLIGNESRIQMMYNQAGTIIAMTHILLPFMILPLYSVMRPINPSYVRAARSLGATSWTAFRRVYLPQTLPGIGAGALLVFILSVGYYITPALVGGASGQLISNLIAYHMQDSLNWSLAAALAALLLAGVLILYWLYDRLIGIDNLKLG